MPDETYPTITPYLIVADADQELKFMQEAFGAIEKNCTRTPSGAIMHSEFQIGDSIIMMGQANDQWKALSANLFLWIPNVDEVYEKALAAGATSIRPPEDMPYGHRSAGLVDACGIHWWLGAPVKK